MPREGHRNQSPEGRKAEEHLGNEKEINLIVTKGSLGSQESPVTQQMVWS
jgi:hypothetical protein